MAGHGGARAGSGPKTGPDGKALTPYKRREPNAQAADSSKTPVHATPAEPKTRRPMFSDAAVHMIIEAMQRQRSRSSTRPRTKEWNPYIIRPDRFGPVADKAKQAKLAMDDNSSLMQTNSFAVQAWQAGGGLPNDASEGMLFLGYPYLSELAQRPEFRLFGEIMSEEMTRKWMEFRGTDDESTKDSSKPKQKNDDDRAAEQRRKQNGEKPRTDQRNKEIERKILEMKDFAEHLKLRDNFKNVAAQDSYFGISHLYMGLKGADPDDPRDPENRSTIGNGRDTITKEKLTAGCLKSLRTIEPVWCYPTAYNASNPMRDDWYDPLVWYVMGSEIHKTRLLPFIGRPVPDILKPSYAFGGLSMTQMAQPYVDIWLRTRESVGEIIHAFSVMILMTNMGTTTMPGGGIGGGGNGDVVARMALANWMRDNQGTLIIDKDTEDFKNISAPISGLDELQAQAQEHLFSIGRIPAVKYAGIQPKGLNATSEGEMRAFNDTVHGQQEHLYRPGLTTVTDIMQISLWGERDPDITFEFLELHEMTPKEKAEIKKLEAETTQIMVDGGAIGNDEWRAKIVADPESGFHGLDPDDVPDLLGEEEAGLIPPGSGKGLEAELGQGGGGEKTAPGVVPARAPTPKKKPSPGGEDSVSSAARGVMLKGDIAQARKFDRLGYLKGMKRIKLTADTSQWNAGFDPEEDKAIFQRKFFALDPEERIRVILHEGAHRAQFISDEDTFGRFARLGLDTEENFLAMANEVHLEDFEQTGDVENITGEVFAESYSRFCLGLEMPADLLRFWKKQRPLARDEWNEADHPRGQPGNAGQFGSGGGGGSGQQKQKGGEKQPQMGGRGAGGGRERQMGERQAGGSAGKKTRHMAQASNLYSAPTRTADQIVASFPGANEAIQKTRQRLAELVPTDALVSEGGFKNPDGTYTKEREALHRKIASSFFTPERVAAALPAKGEKPVLTMLGGRGGSGKSWLTGEHGPVDEGKAILVDADAVKGLLPGYEGWNASAFHEESSEILKLIDQRALELGVNTIHDATMKSEATAAMRMAQYEAAGYEVEGYYMYAAPETAATRALSRYSKKGTFTGRFVPPEIILGNVNNEKNFDKLSGGFRKWAVYDNNSSEGPRLISSSHDD